MLRIMERRARMFGLDHALQCEPAANDAIQPTGFAMAVERVAYFEDLVESGLVALPPHLREIENQEDDQ